MPDHPQLLVGLHPSVRISDVIRDVKSSTSKFINEQQWFKGKFNWQEGYGVFSYSRSQIDTVVKYILNQEEHHRKRTFKEEYIELLNKFEIDYKDEYLFEWIR